MMSDKNYSDKADVNGCKICPDCEGEMKSYEVPIEKSIKIPFTEWELILRNWKGKEWYCYDCVRDKEQDRQAEIFYAGKQEGFNEGYNEGRRY